MPKLVAVLFVFLFFFSTISCFAQSIEIKTNPIGSVFGLHTIPIEYMFSDKMSFELKSRVLFRNDKASSINGTLSDHHRGLSLTLSAKFFYDPKRGADRFYGGVYTKYLSYAHNRHYSIAPPFLISAPNYRFSRYSIGVLSGYKWVGPKGFLLDINAGLGNALNINFKPDILGSSLTVNDAGIPRLDLVGAIMFAYRF